MPPTEPSGPKPERHRGSMKLVGAPARHSTGRLGDGCGACNDSGVGRPVLEREHELAELAAAAQEAAAGTGSVVLVSGEAGIGKSSLVEAARAVLPAAGRIFVGYCDDLATRRVLGPFRDLVGSVGAELTRALQEGGDRNRLLDALRAELSWAGHPTVLAIEDVHWANTVGCPAQLSSARSASSSLLRSPPSCRARVSSAPTLPTRSRNGPRTRRVARSSQYPTKIRPAAGRTARAASTRLDLPIPASPETSTTEPVPAAASCAAAASSASSCSRSRTGRPTPESLHAPHPSPRRPVEWRAGAPTSFIDP